MVSTQGSRYTVCYGAVHLQPMSPQYILMKKEIQDGDDGALNQAQGLPGPEPLGHRRGHATLRLALLPPTWVRAGEAP